MRRTCMHTCGVWYRGAGRSTPFSGQQPSLSGKDGCTESVHAMDCLSNMPQHDRMVSVEAFNRSNAFQGWTPLPPPIAAAKPEEARRGVEIHCETMRDLLDHFFGLGLWCNLGTLLHCTLYTYIHIHSSYIPLNCLKPFSGMGAVGLV